MNNAYSEYSYWNKHTVYIWLQIYYNICSSEIMKIWVDILESYFLYMQAKNLI